MGLEKIKMSKVVLQKGTPAVTALRSSCLQVNFNQLNIDEFAAVLKNLFDQEKYNGEPVTASMPSDRLLLKVTAFPVMKEKELETAVYYETRGLLPEAADDWIIRHVPLGLSPLSSRQIPVLLIAVPRQRAVLFYEAFKLAGIKLSSIDLNFFALWRVAKFWAAAADKPAAVINIGSYNSQLIILQNRYIQYVRVLDVGKRHISGGDFSRLFNEFRTARELFNYHFPQLLQEVIITGEAVDEHDISTAFSRELGLPVKVGIHRLKISTSVSQQAESTSVYSAALGLALKEFEAHV